MDELDKLLNSLDNDGSSSDVGGASSEATTTEEKDPQAASTSDTVGENKSTSSAASEKENLDGEGDGNEGTSDEMTPGEDNDGEDGTSVPETDGKQNRNGRGDREDNGGKRKHRRGNGFSRVEMAEYRASKWKQKAKEAIAARNELAAEFEKYKDLNPRAFDNDEDRMEFLAWKASTAQRLNDMDSNIDSMRDEGQREAFSAKVADFYNDEGTAKFERLDGHYRDAFKFMCERVDPDNVIEDFLSGSRYEAPMREVIYKNGMLQEELFRVYRNPAIGASERLSVLKNLEQQVKDFFSRQSGNNRASGSAVQRPAVNATQNQTRNQATEGNGQARQQRFVLPPQKTGPSSSVRSSNAIARKASGSLTRGSETTPEMSMNSAAEALWNDLKSMGF